MAVFVPADVKEGFLLFDHRLCLFTHDSNLRNSPEEDVGRENCCLSMCIHVFGVCI